MKTNAEIRQEALSLSKGNWGQAVAVTVVFLLVTYAVSAVAASIGMLGGAPSGESLLGQVLSLVASVLVVYPMSFSMAMLFLQFVRGEQKLYVKGIFKSFSAQYYGKSVGVYVLISLFSFLWALLLVVPGIIKSLSYSLAPYILVDNPTLTANQAIDESIKMMHGHKMDLFLILLGYMGLALLSLLALGIPLLWLSPYYQVVLAKFYEEVKADYYATAR